MGDRNTEAEAQLRRELDLILVRLERHDHAAMTEARSEGARLVGDMFADAQLVASRTVDALTYERLSQRARELANALERVRDGSYGSCDECGGTIPAARRRALPGVTTCVQCQERGERVRVRTAVTSSPSSLTSGAGRRPMVRRRTSCWRRRRFPNESIATCRTSWKANRSPSSSTPSARRRAAAARAGSTGSSSRWRTTI